MNFCPDVTVWPARCPAWPPAPPAAAPRPTVAPSPTAGRATPTARSPAAPPPAWPGTTWSRTPSGTSTLPRSGRGAEAGTTLTGVLVGEGASATAEPGPGTATTARGAGRAGGSGIWPPAANSVEYGQAADHLGIVRSVDGVVRRGSRQRREIFLALIISPHNFIKILLAHTQCL